MTTTSAPLPPPRALSTHEREHLDLWRKRVRFLFHTTWIIFVIWLLTRVLIALSLPVMVLWFIVLTGAAVLCLIVFLSGTCPNCGARIGLQARPLLPHSCRKCGSVLDLRRSRSSTMSDNVPGRTG